MGHLGRTIHVSGAIHVEAMKVKRGRLITEIVDGVDNDLVADVGFNDGERPLSVDADSWPLEHPIGVCCYPSYVEVVGDSGSSRQGR